MDSQPFVRREAIHNLILPLCTCQNSVIFSRCLTYPPSLSSASAALKNGFLGYSLSVVHAALQGNAKGFGEFSGLRSGAASLPFARKAASPEDFVSLVAVQNFRAQVRSCTGEKLEMGERGNRLQESDGGGRLDWVMQIESEVECDEILNERERDAHRRHAIYRVPKFFIRDEKRIQAYRPEMVSMGPYHHGEEQLLPLEEHKRKALRRFLVRTGKSIREYRDALRGVVQELMDSYKDLEGEWIYDEERFLQLMIFDGCFMIEIFRIEALRARAHGSLTQKGYDVNDPIFDGCFMIELLRTDGRSTLGDYDENDSIFSRHGIISYMPRIRRDMLMIENQIPLLVLKKLLSVEHGVVDDQDEQNQWFLNKKVNDMVLAFFAPEQEYFTLDMESGLHALDVVRKSMIQDIYGPWGLIPTPTNDGLIPTPTNDVIWPATQLKEAGIKFRKSRSPSLKDIDFSPGYLRPTLFLPQGVVDDATESKFLNLIAFENLHASSGKEVTSYVCFMDGIIDSEKDVSLLSQNDIIKKHVGTDQAIADLFNGISQHASIDPESNLRIVYQAVTNHCRHPTRRLMADFRRGWEKYFYSPWVLVSAAGATAILVITGMQLTYAMLDFYAKN